MADQENVDDAGDGEPTTSRLAGEASVPIAPVSAGPLVNQSIGVRQRYS